MAPGHSTRLTAMTTDTAIFDRLSLLADPTRARLLLALEEQELTVSELCSVLQLPQSTVSRHLKSLGDDGWVASRREGTSRHYRTTVDELPEAARRLWRLTRSEVSKTPSAEEDGRRLATVLAERRSRSQEFFSSAAGQWDRVRRELFGDRAELVPLLALLPREWTVGDLGCGTGRMAEALAPFVSRLVAVDDSPAMLEAARERLARFDHVEVRRGRLEALPVKDGALDVALVSLVLHHLPEPAKAVAEAARVLKPGGRLLVVDMLPHDREEYRQEMGHVWLGFSEERIAGWLDDAGFEALDVTPLPPMPDAQGPGLFVARAIVAEQRVETRAEETVAERELAAVET